MHTCHTLTEHLSNLPSNMYPDTFHHKLYDYSYCNISQVVVTVWILYDEMLFAR